MIIEFIDGPAKGQSHEIGCRYNVVNYYCFMSGKYCEIAYINIEGTNKYKLLGR